MNVKIVGGPLSHDMKVYIIGDDRVQTEIPNINGITINPIKVNQEITAVINLSCVRLDVDVKAAKELSPRALDIE